MRVLPDANSDSNRLSRKPRGQVHMRFPTRQLEILPVLACGLIMCTPPASNLSNRESTAPIRSPECYTLAYSDPVKNAPVRLFPVWVELFPGSDSGSVILRHRPKFDRPGWPYTWWKKLPLDSIEVNFSGNFEAIIIHVQRIGAQVVGRATYLSDLVEPDPQPSMRVEGTREVCPGRVSHTPTKKLPAI
jgi:hypothetical protein